MSWQESGERCSLSEEFLLHQNISVCSDIWCHTTDTFGSISGKCTQQGGLKYLQVNALCPADLGNSAL